MKIGIIVGSIRDGRLGPAVGQWAYDIASQRDDATYELIDLKSFDVPLLTTATPPMAAGKRYESPQVNAWSQAIDACDGFVFVTSEHNHSVPAAFKNAFDSLGSEWSGKPVAFIGYGADNGIRAVEHWRTIISNFAMHDVRAQVSLSLFTDFGQEGFAPASRRTDEVSTMLDQLVAAVRANA